MAKEKKESKIEPMAENVEKDVQGNIAKDVVMVAEPRYRMVPVDQITHKRLMKLCAARGFGQRGQGALVRILINNAYEAERLKQ